MDPQYGHPEKIKLGLSQISQNSEGGKLYFAVVLETSGHGIHYSYMPNKRDEGRVLMNEDWWGDEVGGWKSYQKSPCTCSSVK